MRRPSPLPRLRVREGRLRNGLRVLVCERRGHPVVACQVWYGVGSAHEETARTGIAHFLEHLTFKGTRRFGKGAIDRVTARLGGWNNAFTDADFTVYVSQFASDRWKAALEIEADRMRACLLDPAEFEAERRVVLEEMRMGRDEPWRDLQEEVLAASYLVHPYRRPIIGWEADLRRVTREEVREFYRRHYRPERAFVVLVGDLDAADAIRHARRLFGPIEAPPARAAGTDGVALEEPPARGECRISLRRRTEVPRLVFTFRSSRVAQDDEAALDAAACLLAAGRSSRLHRRLVRETRVATQVSAENETRRDPGLFWVAVEVRAGADPERAEREARAVFEDFARRGPSAKEMRKAKRILLAGEAFERESCGDLAETLGRHAVQARWRDALRYPERVKALRRSAVREAAARFLRFERSVVGRLLPSRDRAGTRETPPLSPPLPGVRADSNPDRSSRTTRLARSLLPAGPPPRVRFPSLRAALRSGLTAVVARNASAPTVSVAAFVEAGVRAEAARLAGLAHLTGALLEEGTRRRSGKAIAEAIESVGGAFESGIGGLAVTVPAEEIALALDLVAEMLLEPSFPAEAVRRRRDAVASEILSDADDPRARAAQRLRELVYGRHPLRRPSKGWADTVRRIRRSDVVAFHRRFYAPDRTILSISGLVEPARLVRKIEERFARWRGRGAPFPRHAKVPRPAPRSALFREPLEQVHVCAGHLGIRRADPDFYPLLVLDQVLGSGSGFTDRLSRRLRDERGLAYSVHASITESAGLDPGMFAVSIGTSAETLREAVEGIRGEVARARRVAPTEDELETAKAYLLGSYVFGLERNGGRALYGIQRERFGLGEDFLERFPDIVRAVTAGDCLRAARKHLRPDALSLAAVGPIPKGFRAPR